MRHLFILGLFLNIGCTGEPEKETGEEEDVDTAVSEDTDTEETDTEETEEPSLQDAAADIFRANCTSGCHNGSSTVPDLSGDLCAAIVNIPSLQIPTMNYVTPEDPASSYLWHKVNGTAGEAGGVETLMPTAGLEAGDVQLVNDWISSGVDCQ